MHLIIATKSSSAYYGNPVDIANLLGVNPETIRRWIRANKEIMMKDGYQIYLNTEKI